jgi:hypothetical protein
MSSRIKTQIAVFLGVIFALTAVAISFTGSTGSGAGRALAQSAPALLVNDCIEVSVGDEFNVDIKATGVSNLMAWEVYFAYNRHKVEVIERDVRRMLATGRSSNVIDVSDPLPNSTGFYLMGAADIGNGDSAKQGDVLVRLKLRAKQEGVTPANIFRGDYTGDQVIDFAPKLTGLNGTQPTYLGDTNGDQLFDGPIASGQIAIDTDCVQPVPPLQPGESEAVPPAAAGSDETDPGVVINQGTETGGGGDGVNPENGSESGSGTEQEQNNGDEGATTDNSQDPNGSNEENGGVQGASATPTDGGGSGIVPWLLIGLGAAVAISGGVTFYMIRAASKEPY